MFAAYSKGVKEQREQRSHVKITHAESVDSALIMPYEPPYDTTRIRDENEGDNESLTLTLT